MTAAAYYTWDFVLPTQLARAASLTDLGDAQLVDDAASPPVPPQMPYSAQLNQWALQLSGVNRIIAAIDIEVSNPGSSPTILNVMAMSSILTTTYCQTNFTVTRNGAGDVSITWPAGSLPAPRGKPRAVVVADGSWLQPVAIPLSNGVEVKTRNSAGALTDVNFVVTVF